MLHHLGADLAGLMLASGLAYVGGVLQHPITYGVPHGGDEGADITVAAEGADVQDLTVNGAGGLVAGFLVGMLQPLGQNGLADGAGLGRVAGGLLAGDMTRRLGGGIHVGSLAVGAGMGGVAAFGTGGSGDGSA